MQEPVCGMGKFSPGTVVLMDRTVGYLEEDKGDGSYRVRVWTGTFTVSRVVLESDKLEFVTDCPFTGEKGVAFFQCKNGSIHPVETYICRNAEDQKFLKALFVAIPPDTGRAWLAKLFTPDTAYEIMCSDERPGEWEDTTRDAMLRKITADQRLALAETGVLTIDEIERSKT